jgi:hypothetical protein
MRFQRKQSIPTLSRKRKDRAAGSSPTEASVVSIRVSVELLYTLKREMKGQASGSPTLAKKFGCMLPRLLQRKR